MTGIPKLRAIIADRRWVFVICLGFLLLGVVYSLATPVLESSDEFKHYPYVQYVQNEWDLPVLEPATCLKSPNDCPWLQTGGQPPAYYALMAAATAWIDTSDLQAVRRVNWHAFIGNPSQICNKNLVIHRPAQEQFPWQGSVLAIHICRLLTLLFGAGTVVLTHRLAGELFPAQPALAFGATVLTAFNPMFLFVSAAVNNDAMAAFVGGLALLLLVRMAKTPCRSSRALVSDHLWLGVVLGIGFLTKLSLLGLVPLTLFVLAFRIWRANNDAPLARRLASIMLHSFLLMMVALAISGWWFVRNWRQYGDPTGLNAFITIQGTRAHPPTLRNWLEEFVTFRWTYWGLFGGVNVMAPRWVYWFFDLLSLLGLSGLVLWGVRWWKPKVVEKGWHLFQSEFHKLMPIAWVGTLFISVLRWTLIFHSFQGRLIFPGISAMSLLLMLGLRQWVPRRYHPALSLGLGVLFLVLAALLPFVTIMPAYAHPEPIALSEVPDYARLDEPLDVGGVARVVGRDLEPQTVRTEGTYEYVEVVVYWEAVAPDENDYISFARLLGREHELVGHINRRPACGMVPTDRWEPGQVWRDPYRIPVADEARSPSVLRLEVGFYHPETNRTLGAAKVGEAKLAPSQGLPQPEHRLSIDLGDGITLRGYDLPSTSTVSGAVITPTLHWRAREAPESDYQVFVHLIGDQPEPVAQADGPPLGGDYPTSLWAAGEEIVDPHPMALPSDLPPGVYRLLVGMYDLETLARLPRQDQKGDSIALSTTITVR